MHLSCLVAAVAVCLVFAVANATYLQVSGPVSGFLHQNDSIQLGKVAPGESFYVLASATTTNVSGAEINIGWDTLKAINLPAGWSAQASPLYENPMKLKITVAPTAADGTYKIVLRAVNIGNYSKLGNLTVNAYINVTLDVLSTNVTPLKLVTGVGQPVNLNIFINNTGASNDPFLINAEGLPAWNSPYEVITKHGTVSKFLYPVFLNEPGVYSFNLTINSTTSPLIHNTYRAQLVVESSVLNDYSATGQGLLLSPLIYEPSYAFMLLLNDIYKLFAR